MVSVVIPAYNCAQYIADTIRSVCAQTYCDLEIVVIDDGSTDGTRNAVLAVTDPRVRYVQTSNRGNYFARNRGIEESKGEFIAFLDSDDLWISDKLEKQMRIFESFPDIDFCCTGFKFFKNNDPARCHLDYSAFLDHDDSTDKTFIVNALRNNFIVTSSVVIRRPCFEKEGVFDTAYQNAMDYDMWLRIVLNYKARYVSEALVLRREHAANISKNRVNTQRALGYIFEKLMVYKARTKFYRVCYDGLVEERLNLSKYYLALEYLVQYQFNHAYARFSLMRVTKKAVLIKFCAWVSRYRLGFFVPPIRWYRQFKCGRVKSVGSGKIQENAI
jgi:glycosyltransferase involved in cell wall biosynthesis